MDCLKRNRKLSSMDCLKTNTELRTRVCPETYTKLRTMYCLKTNTKLRTMDCLKIVPKKNQFLSYISLEYTIFVALFSWTVHLLRSAYIYDVSGSDASPVFRLCVALLFYKLIDFKYYIFWEKIFSAIIYIFRHSVLLPCPANVLDTTKSQTIVESI